MNISSFKTLAGAGRQSFRAHLMAIPIVLAALLSANAAVAQNAACSADLTAANISTLSVIAGSPSTNIIDTSGNTSHRSVVFVCTGGTSGVGDRMVFDVYEDPVYPTISNNVEVTLASGSKLAFVRSGNYFTLKYTPAPGFTGTEIIHQPIAQNIAANPAIARGKPVEIAMENSPFDYLNFQVTVVAPSAPTAVLTSLTPSTVSTGQSSTAVVTLTNPNTTAALSGVADTIALPANVTVSTTPGASTTCGGTITATAGASSVTLTGGTLAASASCTMTFNVTPATVAAHTIPSGTPSATGANAGVAGTTATLTATSPPLPPTISADWDAANVAVNATGRKLTVTLTNPNAVTLTGVGFNGSSLPSGFNVTGLSGTCIGTSYNGGTRTLAMSGHTLAAGASCKATLDFTVTARGAYTFTTGTSFATGPAAVTGSTATTGTLTVFSPPTVAAGVTSPVVINAPSTVTLTYTNPNTSTLTGVGTAAAVSLPANVVIHSTPNATSACGGTVTASAGAGTFAVSGLTVPAGGTCAASFDVTSATAATYSIPTGTPASTEGGNGTAGTSASLVVNNAPPVLTAFTAAAVAYNSTANAIDAAAGTAATNTPTAWTVSKTAGGTFAATAQSANSASANVAISSAGAVTYASPTGFRGNDTFYVRASNAGGDSNVVAVTVPVNNPVLAISRTGSGVRDTPLAGVAIVTTGGQSPYTCGAPSVPLQSGLTLNADCTITGTPTAAGTVNFTVDVTDSSTGTGPFTQQSATLSLAIIGPAPTITALSPAAGPTAGGTVATLTGSDFIVGDTSVIIGGIVVSPANVTVNSSTSLTFSTPAAAAGLVNVTATTSSGTSNPAPGGFTYAAAPTVTSISPTAGPAAGGTTVTITGANFTNATAVNFGATSATGFAVNSATQITAISPTGTGTVDIRVTTVGGLSATSAADQFTYVAAPTITSISPTVGPTGGGTTVTITGTNFAGTTALTFGATPAITFTINSATSITATAPAGTGTVDVRVTTTGGTSATSAADQFTYVGAPTVTAIAPTEGPTGGGTTVTITGTNFTSATAVDFGATSATGFTVNSATQITAISPTGTGTVDIRVTTVGGTSATSAADQFTYVAAPTVTSISPTAGPASGGTTVTITGTNFAGSTAVTFGATAATGFTVNSATQITATAPAGTGTGDIRVTTTGGTSATSAADQFTYVAAPTVTSIAPTAGPTTGGTTVTIIGTNFAGSTNVTFGATAATGFTINSATQITATAPAGTGTVDIRVTTTGGTSATSAADQYTYVGAPAVTSISPTAGPSTGGTSVVITGTDFTGATAVNFGATAATGFTVDSATQITATSPAGTGTVDIRVTTIGGTSATSAADQYTYVAAPTVTSISPTAGPATGGTTVTVTGTNLAGATAVSFGATAATGFTVDSATQITATAPAGSGTVDIRVTTTGGTSATSAADQFTYVGAPTVTAISPTEGPTTGGTSVTITGTGFTGATAVTFGAGPATGYTVNSATEIVATAPAGTGTVDVRITTTGGTSATSAADQFTYVGAPTVTAVSPTEGPTGGGTTVAITGTNFTSATAVDFGATSATGFTVNSATQITATAPAGTGTVDIRVTTIGGTSATSAADQFTYVPAPTVTSISPTAGPGSGGTSVTITGTDFTGATDVSFGATSAGGFTVDSATQITATAPAGTGTVDVRITTAGGTSATSAADQFTYVAAPTVTAISPTEGPTAGGTTVVITGTGFSGTNAVTFGATPATGFTVNSATQITATAPAGTGTADVRVTTTGGASATSAADQFTYVATPTVTSISPTSGPESGGTSVTVSGTSFTAASAVTFGATPATGFTVNNATQITATAPAGTGMVDIRVTTIGGASATSAADQFTYIAAPTAAAVSANVAYDTATPIDLSGSITGVHSSIAIGTAPAHGTTSIAGDVVTYTPAAGYIGADSFTYTATGPGGTSAPATVAITVGNPPAPTAANASATVPYNTVTAINLSTSISGVHTSIAIGAAPAHGTTSIAGDVVTYTPAAGYFGPDSFTYTAAGPGGASAPATVAITVGSPPAPTAANASATVPFNTATAIDLSTSISGVHTSIAVTSTSANGTTSIAGDVVTYTPAAGYFGADSFTYTATGPGGTSAPATVSLTVATPSAPTAAAKSASVAYDTATPIDLNTSITGVHTSIAVATAPANGTTSIAGDVVTYTPTAGYFGPDSFTYTATGPGGTSAPATVSITVATPPPPTVAPASASVAYNTPAAIDLSGSVSGVHSSLAVASAPAKGTTSIAGDVVTYTPNAGSTGGDAFTYTATGPGGTSAPATIGVTIAPPPPGKVTLRVESPDDGTTIFSSPEPALNVSVATSGGSGTSGALTVPAGTFAITFALPENNSAMASCTDPSSTLDVANRSGTITVAPGASQTCTLTLSDISKTTELIGDMLSARGRMILANQPDGSRRIDRLTGNYGSQGGVSGFGLGFSDENIPVALQFSQDEASFAYSLRRSEAKSGIDSRVSAAHGATGGRAARVAPTVTSDDEARAPLSAFADGNGQTTSLEAVQGLVGETEPQTADPMATPFDLWAEGKIAKFSAGSGNGHFGILHAGADYLITPRLLIGLGAQLDWTDLDGEGESSIDGTGFLVGPYVTARLSDNLYFDGRAAWGTSSNTVSPFGTYDDKVDGNRWLISGALIGTWDVDRWRIEPTARLSYFEETTDAYLDSLNFSIPEIESATGTFEFGPTIRYRFAGDDLQLEPFATLEGIWTFEQKNTGSAATSSPGKLDPGLRGRIEVGLSLVGASVGSLSLSGFYDGIGDEDFEAYGGRLRVAHRF